LPEDETWGVDLSFGFTAYSGNVSQEILANKLSLFKDWGHIAGYVSAYINTISSGGSKVQDKKGVTIRFDRKLSKVWKLFVFSTHSQNTSLLVDYRGQIGAGPWYDLRFLKGTHGLSIAIAYQFENYSTGERARVARIAFRYKYVQPIQKGVKAGFDFFYAPALKRFDDRRVAFFPFLKTQIYKKNVSLKISGGFEFDSEPLPTVQLIDRKIISSIEFHLGE